MLGLPASTVYAASNALYIIVVAAAAICTFVIYQSSAIVLKEEKAEFETYKIQAGKDVAAAYAEGVKAGSEAAEAKAVAAKANARAAEADARAAEANAKAQLAQQQSRVEQTQREAQRLQGLLATQSISQREADNAGSDSSLARAGLAQYEASVREAELNLSYSTVTSPLSGIAGRFEFSEGALVSANTSLLTKVSQISPIWVRFSLSDSESAQLGGHLTEANVKEVALILPDGKEYAKKGKMNFAASGIDPQLGTQQLRAVFENADKALLPGQFVRVRVTTGHKDGVFVVPQTAVLTNDQGKFVYVANEKNEATVKPIVVGNWVGKNWVVLSGLKAGEKVIVDNVIKLHPGAAVAPHPFAAEVDANKTVSAA